MVAGELLRAYTHAMTEIRTAVDAQGHTYIVDGDLVHVSVYGQIMTLTREQAREAWQTSARMARARQEPTDHESGRRALHGW